VEAFVSTAVEVVDLTSLCDTSEVIFGPLQGGPFLEDLDDTILHEPIEEAQININAYSSTPVHSDTVPAGPLSSAHELFHVTVKLQRSIWSIWGTDYSIQGWSDDVLLGENTA